MLTLSLLVWYLRLYGLLFTVNGIRIRTNKDTPLPTNSPTPEPTGRPTKFPSHAIKIPVNNHKSSSSASNSDSDSDDSSSASSLESTSNPIPTRKYDHETTANERNGNIQYVDDNQGVINDESDKIQDEQISNDTLSREGLLILIITCLIIFILLMIGIWLFCRYTKNKKINARHERVNTFEDNEACEEDRNINELGEGM